MFLESFLLASSVCMDTLVASFSYGTSKIKIPFASILVINVVCTSILGISLWLGSYIKAWIAADSLPLIGFVLLFILGLIRLCDGMIKSYIERKGKIQNKISFSFSSLTFILHVYSDPSKADIDASKVLSIKEAFTLSLALSLDGIVIGIGAAFASANLFLTIVCTFLLEFLSIWVGYFVGRKITNNIPFDFSWLSGIFLIILAFLKL